jgi:hypothetical protein
LRSNRGWRCSRLLYWGRAHRRRATSELDWLRPDHAESVSEARGRRSGMTLCVNPGEATMKAIVIHQFGSPDVLNVEDVSQPTLGGRGDCRQSASRHCEQDAGCCVTCRDIREATPTATCSGIGCGRRGCGRGDRCKYSQGRRSRGVSSDRWPPSAPRSNLAHHGGSGRTEWSACIYAIAGSRPHPSGNSVLLCSASCFCDDTFVRIAARFR